MERTQYTIQYTVSQDDIIDSIGSSSPPPVCEDSNSMYNSILVSGTAELTLDPVLNDPAVITCGAPVRSSCDSSEISRPRGWLLPMLDTSPETPPVSLQDRGLYIKHEIELIIPDTKLQLH